MMQNGRKFWIAIACADHVARGRAGGFMQVCHGKGGPLARIAPGDRIVYYSPSASIGHSDGLQSFTALGTVADGQPYSIDSGNGFLPFRRDVIWDRAAIAPIRPLLDRMEFTRGRRTWGYAFRFGVLTITASDFTTIETAMTKVTVAAAGPCRPATASRMPDCPPAVRM
ncbi:MAG: EVE domain-containing protein [Paracoccaceae bacterium]